MGDYRQLTQEQRYGIYALLRTGHNQTEIAAGIGVHKSTISRELKRNKGLRGYRYKQAHEMATARWKEKVKPRIDAGTWAFIERLIQQEWSPEQISGWMKNEMGYSISHERIYQHILQDKQSGGNLYRHLRCRKKRKKRYGSHDRRGQIPNRISIDERPFIVDSRLRYGDWEVDTIIGRRHQQAIVSLAERKSRLALIQKVDRKTSQQVSHTVTELLRPVKHRVHTITADNGKEFSGHQKMAISLDANFYFAHPYASWERGLNENTNGLIRQYFPKSRDFTTITDSEIQTVMDKLNNRPRKCHLLVS
ncbi:IS30 family transposase ISAeca1 [subsurface metagenome]